MRTTIAFASIAAAMAAKCTRQELIDLTTVVNGISFTTSWMTTNKITVANPNPLDTYVDTEYKKLSNNVALTNDCWTNCAKPSIDSLAVESAATKKCDTDSDTCKALVKAETVKNIFCLKRNVVEPCTAAMGNAMIDAQAAAYDVAVSKLAAGATASDFKAQFAVAMDAAVKTASTSNCYKCFETYMAAKYISATKTNSASETTLFTKCAAGSIAPELTKCSSSTVNAIKATAPVIDALVAGQQEAASYPKILGAFNTQFSVTDASELQCFMCEVDYLQTVFTAAGARVAGFEPKTAGELTAQETRDKCFLASLETTTTTTAAAGAATTTKASGVASVGVSAAAVVAIALANL